MNIHKTFNWNALAEQCPNAYSALRRYIELYHVDSNSQEIEIVIAGNRLKVSERGPHPQREGALPWLGHWYFKVNDLAYFLNAVGIYINLNPQNVLGTVQYQPTFVTMKVKDSQQDRIPPVDLMHLREAANFKSQEEAEAYAYWKAMRFFDKYFFCFENFSEEE
jgi:hypothetical protein